MSASSQPNLSQYGLSYLNLYARLNSQLDATKAGLVPAFNANLRPKRWGVVIPDGTDPSDGFVAGDWILSADKNAVVYHPTGIAMSWQEAATVNIPPDQQPTDLNTLALPGYALPEAPIPARNLLPNESGPVMTPFGPVVNRTDIVQPPQPVTQQQATDSQNITEILGLVKRLAGVL